MAKKKQKKEMVFPRNLYKSGGGLVLVSDKVKYTYSTILVKDKEEFEKSLADGWCADFSDIIYGEEEAEEAEEEFVEAKVTNIQLDEDDF